MPSKNGPILSHKEIVRLVRSGCPSLGAHQLELWMPESEKSVMKEVEPWEMTMNTHIFPKKKTKRGFFLIFVFFGCWGLVLFGSPMIGISE